MKSNKISVEHQPQDSLWRELTAEESEKVQGGFGFLLLGTNNIRNLISNFLSRISGLVSQVGPQNMTSPGNYSYSVESTKRVFIQDGVTIINEESTVIR